MIDSIQVTRAWEIENHKRIIAFVKPWNPECVATFQVELDTMIRSENDHHSGTTISTLVPDACNR